MGDYTARLSETLVPLVWEHADAFPVGNYNSAWAACANYHRLWLVVNVGTMAAGATLDINLAQATTVAGAGAVAIAAKAITQLTQAGGDGDDLVCIELRTEELNVTGQFDYVRVQMAVAGAQVELSYILFGECTRFSPVPVTAWQEVVG